MITKVEALADQWLNSGKGEWHAAGVEMYNALREIAATMRRGEVEMPEPHKPPMYATSENTPAVRDGYAVGGYEIEEGLYSYDQMVAYADAAVLAAIGDVSLIDEGSKGKPAPKAEPVSKPPLTGRWHHGCGTIVSGTLRIAREDFEYNASDECRDEIFDWICATLNAAIAAAKEQGR
jgi:hypothetical protein